MTLLPPIADQQELDRRRSEETLWRPAIDAIAQRHNLRGAPHLEPDGSAVVFSIGDGLVVKLHEPWNGQLFATEARCLAALHGRLPVTSPELLATGDLEGWRYLVMTRLPGRPLNQVRAELSDAELVAIAADTARLARAIHTLPSVGLEPYKTWVQFLVDQRRDLDAHHAGYPLAEHLRETLPAAIRGAALDCDRPVLLHTELTDTNLMVSRSRGRWHLSGVFDLEPAMLGHPLYDLPPITIFVCRGRPNACAAALDAFGVHPTPELRRDLLACVALHRYSRFDFFLELVDAEPSPRDWHAATTRLFGF